MFTTRKFEVDDDEYERLLEFDAEHLTPEKSACEMGPGGTMGDKYVLEFTPSGIGTFVGVRCPCGTRITLSDLDKF